MGMARRLDEGKRRACDQWSGWVQASRRKSAGHCAEAYNIDPCKTTRTSSWKRKCNS